jgi:hypothetical protein
VEDIPADDMNMPVEKRRMISKYRPAKGIPASTTARYKVASEYADVTAISARMA